MRISKNFTIEEMCHSDTAARAGIVNQITTARQRDALFALVRKVLQPLRDKWGKPIRINSGFRSPELNRHVGGVPESQHCKGEAADLHTGSHAETYKLARLIRDTPELWGEVDQLILYPTFVHVSHKLEGRQRQQLLYNYRYRGEKV